MKNKILTIIILLILLSIFTIFVFAYKNKYEVLNVKSADRITVDINHNGTVDSDEVICIDKIESFEYEPDENFYNQYSKKYGLNNKDLIGLWYLGREFGYKTLLNKKIILKLKKNGKHAYCRTADVYIDGVNYKDLVYNAGFGFINNKAADETILKQNIEKARKLNLVILNHHSNKYHTLDCEYGNMAHDKIIIPFSQLPKDTSPCHFCHKINNKKYTKHKVKTIQIGTSPALKATFGDIIFYRFDYTKHLKPNSNCTTEVCKMVIEKINNAQKNIDIAMYGYDNIPAITIALNNAKTRGVKIRYVYDEVPDGNKTFYRDNDRITAVSIYYKSDRLANESGKFMHNKFIIFDNSSVLTGSMNFSPAGLSGYDINDVIIINSQEVAKLYTTEFEQMIDGKFHNKKSKHNLPNKFIIGDSQLEVYFSPQDKSSARIVDLLNNATKYVYIPTFLITHKGISDAIVKAKKRGVDVKIIIDANNVNIRNTKHTYFKNNAIPMKAENYAGKLHSKSMIIDDEYVITGSMNFSNSGENKNDENMLVIKNNLLAKNYKEFFLYLWKVIPDKYLKYAPRAESFESIGSCSDGVDNNFDGKTDSADAGCQKK